MNTLEINNILRKPSPGFSGVYPAYSLSLIKGNSFAILNTQEANKSGAHWIAIFYNDQKCEFFDSLGRNPKFYHSYWHDFLINKSGEYLFNDERLQNEKSDDCGKFCIFYVVLRSHGIQFSSIISLLKRVDLDSFVTYLIMN